MNGVPQTPASFTNVGLATDSVYKNDSIGTYTFTTAGAYIIKVWTSQPDGNTDGNNTNDTLIKTFFDQGYASIPFNESFNGTWVNYMNTRDVPSTYWVNTPATGNNSWRRDDDGAAAAWTNTATGAYTPAGVGNAPLHSARFHSGSATSGSTGTMDAYIDFSTVGTKLLKFWHINTSGNDTLMVYISNNGGTSYSLLQKIDVDAAWTQHTINLGSSTAANTIVRFSVTNSYTIPTGLNDVGLDSVQVYLKPASDMAAVVLIAPTSGCGNTSSDAVTIRIANVGGSSQSNIPVKYSIDGGLNYVKDTVTGPINAGDSVNFTYIQHANLSTPGTYNCIAVVDLAGDANLSDDTVKATISSVNAISGNPFTDNLEAGNLHYLLTNGVNSKVALASKVGYLSTKGFYMIGSATAGTWAGGNTSTTTTAHQAYSYTDHVAKVSTCIVDASAFPTNNLYLNFDLKQTHSSTGTKYSWFTVVVNRAHGTDTLSDITGAKYFNPATATGDAFANKIYNISAYRDSIFTIGFVSSCKTATDSAKIDNITLSAKPVVNLGKDTTVCKGTSVIIDAGEAAIGYTYTYNWSTTLHPASIATTQAITTDSSATYIVTVDNGFGVTSKDTINVFNYQLPIVSLGRDTTNCVSYTLDAGAAFHTYTWSTGATTQTINVNTTGTYWVDVTNTPGCIARDSANITIIPMPTANAGNTQSICFQDTLNLLGSSATTYDSLLWVSSGDGHFTDSTLLHPRYILGTNDITNTLVTLTMVAYGHCGNDTSAVLITITTAPNADAGIDTVICKGNNVQLLATGGNSYLWSPVTGLSDATIANPIASPTTTTTYTVTVTSTCGSATDNVKVTVDNITAPSIGKDTTLCDGDFIILNAGAGYDSYSWSTGATTQTINFDNSILGLGTFHVWVDVAKGKCSSTDTINLTYTACLGIKELSNNISIKVSPNPSNGLTNINVNGLNSEANFSIYSLQGQAVYTNTINGNSSIKVDLTNVPKGVYFIRINNEKNNIISKFILQ